MNEDFVDALYRQLTGAALIEAEKRTIKEWISRSEHHHRTYDELTNFELLKSEVRIVMKQKTSIHWNKLKARLPVKKKDPLLMLPLRLLHYAAMLMLLIIVSAMIYFRIVNIHKQEAETNKQQSAKPENDSDAEKPILHRGFPLLPSQ